MMKLTKLASNFYRVDMRGVSFYFSYETCVAYDVKSLGGLVCSKNVWSRTTGKHLNMIQPDKSRRLPHDLFAACLAGVLA